MRSILLGGLAALVLATGAQAAVPNEVPATVNTTWRVTLDAGGHVTALEQHSKVKSAVAGPLEAAIRGWTFEPGKLDGVPAVTETTLDVSVALEPQGEGFAVRVEDVRTGGGIEKTVAPQFPREQLRKNVAAQVVLEVRYDASGKVTSVEPAPDAPAVARDFTRSAIKAVRRWQFWPERVAGHGIPATVKVPICYSTGGRHAPAPRCEAPTTGGARAATESPVTDNPEATIKVDVIGRKL